MVQRYRGGVLPPPGESTPAEDRLQALALSGSETRYIMSGQARKGRAVLQLVRRSGQWGIFRVVLGDKRAEKDQRQGG